jgi:hypothetical protein
VNFWDGISRVLSDDRIHTAAHKYAFCCCERGVSSVDFELHAAVGETAFEEVAVEFGVVEFEDAAMCDGAEDDHRTMRLVSSK